MVYQYPYFILDILKSFLACPNGSSSGKKQNTGSSFGGGGSQPTGECFKVGSSVFKGNIFLIFNFLFACSVVNLVIGAMVMSNPHQWISADRDFVAACPNEGVSGGSRGGAIKFSGSRGRGRGSRKSSRGSRRGRKPTYES